ncbi:hypothetical protein [Salinicola tamaricis]|uniref:hypothetical protein n=1 Tax=Salinicola tamaricis TaxID=1771309 RepID=UPI0013EBCDC6|nr:hypothetical protein [Salinicola tamaricis]
MLRGEVAHDLLGIEIVSAAPLVAEVADGDRTFAGVERLPQAIVVVDARGEPLPLGLRELCQPLRQALAIVRIGDQQARGTGSIEAQLAALEADIHRRPPAVIPSRRRLSRSGMTSV